MPKVYRIVKASMLERLKEVENFGSSKKYRADKR